MRSSNLAFTMLCLGALTLAGCATPDRSLLPANANPQAEIERIDTDLQAVRDNQYDQLAPKSYDQAIKAKEAALKAQEKGKSTDQVLDQVAFARAAINEVNAVGAEYAGSVKPVLEARRSALDAQAEQLQERKFKAADGDLQSMGRTMERKKFEVNANEIARLQKDYQIAEIEARKISLLGGAKNRLEQAGKDGARRKTPKTYETAKAMIQSAENAIETSPRAPAGYSESVKAANDSAQKLTDVLGFAKGKDASESAALTMWEQQRMLQASKSELAASAQNAQALEGQLSAEQQRIAQQQRNLTSLQASNKDYADEEALRQKIEDLKKTFSPDEAEIVKDGNNLIVRLKKINFTSGRAELSSDSYGTLKKVEDLIAAVPAQQITVEGHTDSTGSQKINQSLSEKRAESVKDYLASQNLNEEVKLDAKGFGSERPLGTNKTKAGRAMNRRVDIVIQTNTVL